MITYSELFQFVIMLMAFATFIYQVSKKNNRPAHGLVIF